ncbi:DUF3783 domain-containing protein [Laedolimicola intestinihominis]|uniref:DUF3783 domain-containing protein n=1 Tax=Laedolimicola intestinihominis TaxID=3133166 RepID=A0ABV1FII9_9FIRM
MAIAKELVLYYTPEKSDADRLLKGVLVRMGIRIRNITPEQTAEKVGALAGLPGYEEQEKATDAPVIPEKLLVLHGFGQRRLQELLGGLRKAKVPPIPMKAMVTEHNADWPLYELYQEIRKEHEMMTEQKESK